MLRKFLNNRKGTAEVIGSVMFIVILLFFFTNVYLWHDAATKEMNDLYVDKINSPITVSVLSDYQLNVTNNGGIDTTLSMLWIDVKSSIAGSPDSFHGNSTLNTIVPAGSNGIITWNSGQVHYTPQPGDNVRFKVITTVGNSAACSHQYT